MIVHQWVPAMHAGDAVGNHARALRARFRAWDHESDIFALTIDRDMADQARPWGDADSRDADVTILHFAIPSPMSEALATLPGRRILLYHNVTPAHFFAPYDPALADLAVRGREQLEDLAGRVDLALGVSEYNRSELEDAGFDATDVLPIPVDADRLRRAPAVPALDRLLGDGLVNILHVGRIAPNKKIEDHLRLAEVYKRYVDAQYRFIFVGPFEAVPRYSAAIRAMVGTFQMRSDRFWFTGAVPDVELAAYYRHAHAYVSLSEHEGFCVPLVEAMAMDVPVLAYDAAAVPETLGGAGLCFAPKDLEFAAELLGEIVYNETVRRSILDGQQRRLRDFSSAAFDTRLKSVLAPMGL